MTDKSYNSGELKLSDLTKGDRVELHPATDAWMMGDRYGTVTRVTKKHAHVRMDKSGTSRKVPADCIGSVLCDQPAPALDEDDAPSPGP